MIGSTTMRLNVHWPPTKDEATSTTASPTVFKDNRFYDEARDRSLIHTLMRMRLPQRALNDLSHRGDSWPAIMFTLLAPIYNQLCSLGLNFELVSP